MRPHLYHSEKQEQPVLSGRHERQSNIGAHIDDQRSDVNRSSTKAIAHCAENRWSGSLKNEINGDGLRYA